MLYSFLRRLLFCLPTECSHHLALRAIQCIYPPCRVKRIQRRATQKPVSCLGFTLPNAVGLAAGLDKNGDYIDALFGLGFGFIEVGAVTPKPQKGNPKPRLFRLPKAKALINKMGFNNLGVDHLVRQLKSRKVPGIVGVNIGKNAATPLETAYEDYEICLEKVYPYADFVTINISSPNTVGLRELQGEVYLADLLGRMKLQQKALESKHKRYVPLLVKFSPDLSRDEVNQMVDIVLQAKMDGIIATNTSQDRSTVSGLKHAEQGGGLSGEPIFKKSLAMITQISQQTGGSIPLIAVGGISSAQDAIQLLSAGATLVQIYTGLIYQGPRLVRQIISSL